MTLPLPIKNDFLKLTPYFDAIWLYFSVNTPTIQINLISDLLFYQCSNLTMIISAISSGFLMLSFLHYVYKTYLYFSVAHSVQFSILFKIQINGRELSKDSKNCNSIHKLPFFNGMTFQPITAVTFVLPMDKNAMEKLKFLLPCKKIFLSG